MYAIESTNLKGWRWISGVFLDRMSVEQELGRIASKPGANHVLVQGSPSQFPFFIVEENGFNYVLLSELVLRLNATEPQNDDGHVHFNVYAVCAPFKPEVPGRDEMGGILHWHITDSALHDPRATVFRAELAELARDA